MRTSLKTQYQELLKRHGCSTHVIEHCAAVSKLSLELADKVNIPLDRELLFTGAMLHDIGRCRTNSLKHIVAGAEIARAEGLPEEVARIIERHIGAGISRTEAEELGLPAKDYIPTTPEEIIVSYADNLTKGTAHITFPDALRMFEKKLGSDHPAVERFRKQHRDIEKWVNRS